MRSLAPLALLLTCACATTNVGEGLIEDRNALETLPNDDSMGTGPIRFVVDQRTLPSGMRVGFETIRLRGQVGVALWVSTGRSHDPAGKPGVAALLARLSSRAHAPGKPGLDSQLRALGAAAVEQRTLPDATLYFTLAPRKALAAVLALQAQRLLHPLDGITPRDLENEKKLVAIEGNQRTGLQDKFDSWMSQAVFPHDHPYGQLAFHDGKSIEKIALDDVAEMARTRYTQANSTMLIYGDASVKDADAIVAQEFPAELSKEVPGAVAVVKREPVPLPDDVPPTPATGSPKVTAQVARPHILIGWSLPSVYASHGATAGIATSSIWNVMSSHFADLDPNIIDVDFRSVPMLMGTLFTCDVTLEKETRLAEIYQLVAKEMQISWQWGPSGESTSLGFALLMGDSARGQLLMDLEDPFKRGEERALHFNFSGEVLAYNHYIDELSEVRPRELIDFGMAYFTVARSRAVFVVPDRSPTPTAGGFPARKPAAEETLALSGSPPVASPWMVPEQTERFTLPNGLDVMLVRRTNYPIVVVGLGFPGGPNVLDAPARTLSLLKDQTQSLYSFRGAANAPVRTVHLTDMTLDIVRTGRASLANALLALAARQKVYDHQDIEPLNYVGPEGGRMDRREQRTETRIVRDYQKALYPDHPYGRHVLASEMRDLDKETIQGGIRRERNPRNAHLLIVGDIDLDQAHTLAQRWFGPWEPAGDAQPSPVPAANPGAVAEHDRVLALALPEESTETSSVQIGCRLPAASRETLATYRVLPRLVVQAMDPQRIGDGASVAGVSVELNEKRGGSTDLTVSLTVGANGLLPAIKNAQAAFASLAAGNIGQDMLNRARWETVADLNRSNHTTTSVFHEIMEGLNHDLEPSRLLDLPQDVSAVTAAALGPALRTCRDTQIVLVAGKKSAVGAAVDELSTQGAR